MAYLPVQIRTLATGEAASCEAILRDLPDWFGIESALQMYVRDVERYPTWLAETDGSGSDPSRAVPSPDSRSPIDPSRAVPSPVAADPSTRPGLDGATGFGGQPIGFITLHQHFPHAAEIHCLAVRRAWHRAGVGCALVRFVEEECRRLGVRYLQVKTLGPSRPCPFYDKTREFYLALDFTPLEEMLTLWPGNPCLVLVKTL